MEIKNSKLLLKNLRRKFLILTFAFLILFALQIEAAPFTDNGDGTVKDNATGLVWKKCSNGLSGTSCSTGTATTYTWANAVTACTSGWRLPSINELKTIVDTTKASGATIDTTAFPATFASYYWSSTTYAPSTTAVWIVSFFDGLVDGNGKANFYYVRCVSGP